MRTKYCRRVFERKRSATHAFSRFLSATLDTPVGNRFACLADTSANSIRSRLLSITSFCQYRQTMSELAANSMDDRHWDVFRAELHSSVDRQTILRVIVDSGAAITGTDRLVLIEDSAGSLNVLAVTGTRSLNARSDEVRSLLKSCREIIATSSGGQWADRPAESKSAKAFRLDRLSLHPANPGSAAVDMTAASDSSQVTYYVLAEAAAGSIDRVKRFPETLREIAIALQRCPQLARSKSSAWKKIFIGAAVVVAGLVLIPWEFELEVPAFAFPKERRSLFAPENGIVDQVSVSEGASIEAGQTLVTLKNSQLAMQLRSVQGDKDTTSVRLRALGIARTSAAAGSDLAQELIREELQLEQKLRTLEAETTLLQTQMDSLTLKAPIEGMVFQRRLHERLDQRPVQRGQLLLEIGQTDGPWELELQIPASSAGYVPIPLGATVPENGKVVPVRFRTEDADAGQGRAELTSISMGSEISEGRLVCIATASILSDQIGNPASLRPGQAVTARISCGKRSLGFVLFRDVIQSLRRMWFLWT